MENGLKLLLVSIVVMWMSLVNTFAQEARGKVVPFENDTLDVMLKIPEGKFWNGGTPFTDINYLRIQQGVTAFDENREKINVKAKTHKAYYFMHDDKKVVMVSKKRSYFTTNLFAGSYIFVKHEIGGELNLYRFYYDNNNTAGTGNLATYSYAHLLEKEFVEKNGVLNQIRAVGFRKTMMQLCQGCEELVADIKNRKYSKYELKEIVEYYNSSCSVRN